MAESTQTLDWAVAILRVLADDHRQGVRLTDVADRAGLSKSTAHRILVALVKRRRLSASKDTSRL